jgi:two-component system response regulator ChvI
MQLGIRRQLLFLGEHMTKIAFIDDQQGSYEAVRGLLAAEGFELDRHRDATFALSVFSRRLPDLVVINLSSASSFGMKVLERIRLKWSVPVVMLLPTRDEVDEILCLRLGADDVIGKPVSARLLSARLTSLLRRHAILHDGIHADSGADQVITQGDLIMDPSRHEVLWKEQPVALTVTEFNLLISLARRPGVVKNRDRLLSEVYTDEIYVDDRTIDSHIKRIRKKIRAVDPGFDAIETLYGVGYRFVMPTKALVMLHRAAQDPAAHLIAA